MESEEEEGEGRESIDEEASEGEEGKSEISELSSEEEETVSGCCSWSFPDVHSQYLILLCTCIQERDTESFFQEPPKLQKGVSFTDMNLSRPLLKVRGQVGKRNRNITHLPLSSSVLPPQGQRPI